MLRTSSVLSLLGSSYIAYNLLGPQREKELKKRMFSRLLLGLSISDVVASTAFFLGDWPVPADSLHSNVLYDNRGTQATCNAQGFFIQVFYYSSIFYTASLSFNFLLCVKYQMKQDELKRRVEPYLHAVAWLIPLVLAIVALVFEMYNPTVFFCYVSTYPMVSALRMMCERMCYP